MCALHRPAFALLSDWAAGIAEPQRDDEDLIRYGAAIERAEVKTMTVDRTVRAARQRVWHLFTDPASAARWWHPRHFAVSAFRFEVRVGGVVELGLVEGDGAEFFSRGRVLRCSEPSRLTFTLDPLDADGRSLFVAHHDVRLTTSDGETRIRLSVTPSAVRPGAEAAVGGLRIGWEQLLENLADVCAGESPLSVDRAKLRP